VEQILIEFKLFGLHLQEPMALITNWMMSAFCFFAFYKLRKNFDFDVIWWKRFFLIFAISTFFGGLGHLLFQYFERPGKFPNWMTGILAGYFAGKSMLVHMKDVVIQKRLEFILIFKGSVFLILGLAFQNFLFIAIDSIVTYLFFCGVLGYVLFKKGILEMRFIYYGVLICLPSAFIFILKFNLHKWLNKDDLSHFLMLACLVFFFIGASKRAEKNALDSQKIS
jgi:hypothetical protein